MKYRPTSPSQLVNGWPAKGGDVLQGR